MRRRVLHWAARSAAPAIAALLTACGPVGEPSTIHPVEVVARQAVEAAIRVALAETCRATYPPEGAHPVHRIAWALACAQYPMPGAGVPTLPPSPPASPPATIAADAAL